MSHHVGVGLPDGRHALADYRQPITGVMRRINQRLTTMSRRAAEAASAGDFAIIGRWLDQHPEQACTGEQIRAGTCTHPPATAEHFTPPPYREGALF